jgi:GxxExxY protein
MSATKDKTLKHTKILFPELSYQVMGAIFQVFKELGYGFQEKYYHRALAAVLQNFGIPFRQEVYHPILFRGKIIGRYFIDFIIDNKIALEIKVGREFYPKDWKQLSAYLKATGLPLGILILFTKDGVRFRRIANA